VGDEGLEPPVSNSRETPLCSNGGTHGGTLEPKSSLQQLIDAWHMLPATVQADIMQLVELNAGQ
jgi:hypothetical protein